MLDEAVGVTMCPTCLHLRNDFGKETEKEKKEQRNGSLFQLKVHWYARTSAGAGEWGGGRGMGEKNRSLHRFGDPSLGIKLSEDIVKFQDSNDKNNGEKNEMTN